MEKCINWIQSTSNNARKIKSVNSICDCIYIFLCERERKYTHAHTHMYVSLKWSSGKGQYIRNASNKINENQKHKLHIQLRFI